MQVCEGRIFVSRNFCHDNFTIYLDIEQVISDSIQVNYN